MLFHVSTSIFQLKNPQSSSRHQCRSADGCSVGAKQYSNTSSLYHSVHGTTIDICLCGVYHAEAASASQSSLLLPFLTLPLFAPVTTTHDAQAYCATQLHLFQSSNSIHHCLLQLPIKLPHPCNIADKLPPAIDGSHASCIQCGWRERVTTAIHTAIINLQEPIHLKRVISACMLLLKLKKTSKQRRISIRPKINL